MTSGAAKGCCAFFEALMQTFLPHRSFSKSAETLDYRRLGKQRVEAKQILEAIRKGGVIAAFFFEM